MSFDAHGAGFAGFDTAVYDPSTPGGLGGTFGLAPQLLGVGRGLATTASAMPVSTAASSPPTGAESASKPMPETTGGDLGHLPCASLQS